MMTAITFAVGFVIGFAAGFFAGYDLGHSSHRLFEGKVVLKVVFGLLRRLAVITAGWLAALAIGRPAFAGAAAGSIGGFALAVSLKVRA